MRYTDDIYKLNDVRNLSSTSTKSFMKHHSLNEAFAIDANMYADDRVSSHLDIKWSPLRYYVIKRTHLPLK
jgi:hypothetical protein